MYQHNYLAEVVLGNREYEEKENDKSHNLFAIKDHSPASQLAYACPIINNVGYQNLQATSCQR